MQGVGMENRRCILKFKKNFLLLAEKTASEADRSDCATTGAAGASFCVGRSASN